MNKHVLIVGGGPAGLEAAIQLKRMGHSVSVVERREELGGHLTQWNKLFPMGDMARDILAGLKQNLTDVDSHTNSDVKNISRQQNGQFAAELTDGTRLTVDAVLMASGFDLFRAEKKQEYGYGIYDHVVTNADIEHYLTTGKDPRIGKPRRIAFVHCVGSRDEKSGCRSCSKVCCVNAVKQASEMRARFPESEIFCFYIDLRMFGRRYEDLYLKAQRIYGVRFVRGRVAEVAEKLDGTLQIKAEDTTAGKPMCATVDLLVLMAGVRPSAAGRAVCDMLGAESDDDGYLKVRNVYADGNKTTADGVFVTGAASGPKTLSEAFRDARSAAAQVDEYLTAQSR